MKSLKHLKKILIHKFWVFYYCCKLGIPWQGIVHDLSKFSPTEFFESAKYYQGDDSPINAAKRDKGYSDAWFHHKGRNKHHYEFWMDDFDHGGKNVLMPFNYALEMIADYLGAGRAYQGKDFTFQGEYEWWLSRSSNNLAMNEKLQDFTTKCMKWMAENDKVVPRSVAYLYYE